MPMKNYCDILGAGSNASYEDIRKEFRRPALRHHSDRNPENIVESEAKFKDINEAYYENISGMHTLLHEAGAVRRKGSDGR